MTMKRNGNFEGVIQIILKQEPKLGHESRFRSVLEACFLPTDKAFLGNLPAVGSPAEESLPSPHLS